MCNQRQPWRHYSCSRSYTIYWSYPRRPKQGKEIHCVAVPQYFKAFKNTKIKRAVQNRFGPNVGAWSAYDAVGWCTHYIMTESVVGETEEKYKRDSSDFNHINMLLSSYYAQNIPTICFTTFGINPSATFGRGGTRYAPHANLVRREIPIVFLDCRKRDVMIPETGYSSDHPLIKMLKVEGYFIQQEKLYQRGRYDATRATKVITQKKIKTAACLSLKL